MNNTHSTLDNHINKIFSGMVIVLLYGFKHTITNNRTIGFEKNKLNTIFVHKHKKKVFF